jgi:hypothetical protein
VRRSVPVRTFNDWHDPPPGFFEADLVAQSGPKASGSFVQTLVLNDIATGWTECAPLLAPIDWQKEQGSDAILELRRLGDGPFGRIIDPLQRSKRLSPYAGPVSLLASAAGREQPISFVDRRGIRTPFRG